MERIPEGESKGRQGDAGKKKIEFRFDDIALEVPELAFGNSLGLLEHGCTALEGFGGQKHKPG